MSYTVRNTFPLAQHVRTSPTHTDVPSTNPTNQHFQFIPTQRPNYSSDLDSTRGQFESNIDDQEVSCYIQLPTINKALLQPQQLGQLFDDQELLPVVSWLIGMYESNKDNIDLHKLGGTSPYAKLLVVNFSYIKALIRFQQDLAYAIDSIFHFLLNLKHTQQFNRFMEDYHRHFYYETTATKIKHRIPFVPHDTIARSYRKCELASMIADFYTPVANARIDQESQDPENFLRFSRNPNVFVKPCLFIPMYYYGTDQKLAIQPRPSRHQHGKCEKTHAYPQFLPLREGRY